MASEANSPDFDWLKKQELQRGDDLGREFVPGQQMSLEENNFEGKETESFDPSAEGSNDSSSIHQLPPAVNNQSDGTTLIIKGLESSGLGNPHRHDVVSRDDTANEFEACVEEFAPVNSASEVSGSDMAECGQNEMTERVQVATGVDMKTTETAESIDLPNRRNPLLILLISYASLMTLVAIFLAFGNGRQHPLESLPDVEPEAADTLSYVKETEPLPPGHTLQIGDSRRFGNILVEPLEVVREPIHFEHYSGDETSSRAASSPVYKLKLRFTNVSSNQEIAPFDRRLTLRRVVSTKQQREFSNYYIIPGQSHQSQELIGMYPLTSESDWDMAGQKLGCVLKPDESFETYLASEEGIDLQKESFKWRFQFRKGYSKSGNGVTTMAEVVIDPGKAVVHNPQITAASPAA